MTRRTGERARRTFALSALVVFGLLVLAPVAAAAEGTNPWDRPQDPLEPGPASQPPEQAPADPAADAEAADRCADVVGLPASIGCRLVQGGLGGADVAGGLVDSVASSAFDGFVETVTDGAVWFLGKVASLLDSGSRPAITESWFGEQYQRMVALTSIIVLPLVLVAIADAVVHAQPGQIIKTLFVYLPLAGIVTVVALEMVDLALVITDWASAVISGGVAADSARFLEDMGAVLSGSLGEELPAFAVFIGSIFAVFAAFVLWIELILREAGINLAVLFLPLSFATMVWPRISRWASRALRLLAALILSKFFIVAVISLGASMLSGAGAGAGLETVIAGVALLAMASFTPWVLWSLLAPVESGLDTALAGAARLPSAGALPAPATAAAVGARFGGASSGGPLPVAGAPAPAGATARASGDGGEAVAAAKANADANRRGAQVPAAAAASGGGGPGGAGPGGGPARGSTAAPPGNGNGSADGGGSGYGAGVEPERAPAPAPSGVASPGGFPVPADSRRGAPPPSSPAPPEPPAPRPSSSPPGGGRG